MRRPRSDGAGTRERLLVAAAAVFAEKGYRDATLAGICRAARANVAAANYHFGGKEALYAEAWKHAFHRSIAEWPPDGGVPAAAPAAERLRGRIRALLLRIGAPDNRDFAILAKEMELPTGLLAETARECLEPLRRDFEALVRELLGPGADASRVRLCHLSVLNQCFGPMLRRLRRGPDACRGHAGPEPTPEELAGHIATFSLAGIRACRGPRGGGAGSSRKETP